MEFSAEEMTRRLETVRTRMDAAGIDCMLITGFGAKRIGCEFGLEMRLGIPPADFESIVKLLPDVEFVDASAIIWSLRMFKSPEEVARLRKACEITSTTRQQVFQQVQPGMT